MRGKVLVDGPVQIEIAGDLVTVRGTSDGEGFTLVFSVQDALLSAHRLEQAYAGAMAERETHRVIPLPPRIHADIA